MVPLLSSLQHIIFSKLGWQIYQQLNETPINLWDVYRWTMMKEKNIVTTVTWLLGCLAYSCNCVIGGAERHLVQWSLIFFSDLGFGMDQTCNLINCHHSIFNSKHLHTVHTIPLPLFLYWPKKKQNKAFSTKKVLILKPQFMVRGLQCASLKRLRDFLESPLTVGHCTW